MGRILNTIAVVGLATAAVACGSDGAEESSDSDAPADSTASDDAADNSDSTDSDSTEADSDDEAQSAAPVDPPSIVVTTNILGDVVAAAVGDSAQVDVIMPLGSSPHDFAPSARQAETMENADLLIVNGAGFEEGMLDVIANVADSGTAVFTIADHVELLEFTGDGHDHGDEGHDDHGDEDHDDHGDEDHDDHGDEDHDDHGDEDKDEGHSHSDGDDPHLWTDPARMVDAVTALEPVVAALDGVDADALSTSVDAYLAELAALDAAMDASLASIPDSDRVLVTNHQVFGYFADRFEFEVVGAIIPSLTTNAEASAADIEELAELIEAEGIAAIFGENTQSSQLAEVLADEVGGDVAVVELFGESLGEEGSGAETYIGMMQANADLIAEALSS